MSFYFLKIQPPNRAPVKKYIVFMFGQILLVQGQREHCDGQNDGQANDGDGNKQPLKQLWQERRSTKEPCL